MGKDVIVACDFSSAEATFAFLDKFTGRKTWQILKNETHVYNNRIFGFRFCMHGFFCILRGKG